MIKINLAKSAGFCFGVKRALQIAFETARSNKAVFMLGDIVHNDQVVKAIEDIGIKKIKRLGNGRNKILLIRAHGTSTATLSKARQLGYRIVDATCPMVKEIHRIAREKEKQGYKLVVIGDKKHDEVLGIIGQLRHKAMAIDGLHSIPLKSIRKIKKACLVVQSTQNLDNVLKIIGILKKNIKELVFFNTICTPTRIKQQEIKRMPLTNKVMIIIGSRESANTKRLYEISRSLNKRSYWVQSKDEIKPDWFRDVKTVGITAGASTPETTTQIIIEHIKALV
jgi:4-hydroxy-3-methylbut-2-enyl diphosphate reductase